MPRRTSHASDAGFSLSLLRGQCFCVRGVFCSQSAAKTLPVWVTTLLWVLFYSSSQTFWHSCVAYPKALGVRNILQEDAMDVALQYFWQFVCFSVLFFWREFVLIGFRSKGNTFCRETVLMGISFDGISFWRWHALAVWLRANPNWRDVAVALTVLYVTQLQRNPLIGQNKVTWFSLMDHAHFTKRSPFSPRVGILTSNVNVAFTIAEDM